MAPTKGFASSDCDASRWSSSSGKLVLEVDDSSRVGEALLRRSLYSCAGEEEGWTGNEA